jgi:fatty-acyl-CoA synthase
MTEMTGMTGPQTGISYAAMIVEALTRHRGSTAFIQDDRSISFGETAESTSRIQQVLAAKGITEGSCLGALSVNTPEVWMVQAAGCLGGAR